MKFSLIFSCILLSAISYSQDLRSLKKMKPSANKIFAIQAGDHLTTPKGTPHSVTKIFVRNPLQVLSIQSPKFDDSDRIFSETIQP